LQEEEMKDIYGSGEERWKEKEHPWENQLKEASADLGFNV